MRLLIQIAFLLFGINLLLIIAVLDSQAIEETTLDLYLVSTGRGFNSVYYADHRGLYELPFSTPPGFPSLAEQQPFSTMMAEMLIRDGSGDSTSRIRFPLNNSPRAISHLGELPVDQKPRSFNRLVDSFPHHKSALALVAIVCFSGGVMLASLQHIRFRQLNLVQ